MASVLLGLCEESITTQAGTSWQDNKFGGMPDWQQSTTPHPNCGLCGWRSVFICQLYCPVTNSPYHRTLYIFACCNKSCKNQDNSWTVLRFQSLTKSEPKKSESHSPDSDADYWGVGKASWSDDNDDEVAIFSAKSEFCESEIDTCSTASESTNDQEMQNLQDEFANDLTANFEKVTEGNERQSVEDPVTKLSQLSMIDTDELIANPNTTSPHPCSAAGEGENLVLVDNVMLNPCDSILSKILVDINTDSGSISSMNEVIPTELVLKSYYINAYSEEDFAVDMKYCLALERKYLKEDLDLQSFLCERDEQAYSQQKRGKKSTRNNIEKDTVNEYDKKPVHFDHALLKFSEKVKLCPKQVIRYSYNGAPLHFDETAAKRQIPVCRCGSPRIFEMQLMPGTVDYLKLSQASDSILEFGSVYVYSCANNCWVDGATEPCHEFIFCVKYSDQKLFRA